MMNTSGRVWALRAAGAAAVGGILVWMLWSHPDAEPADLAPARTVWWIDVPDLPGFLDAASSSGVAKRLENDPVWKSLLDEPAIHERIRSFSASWPKVREVLDRRCALAGVLDPDGKAMHTVLFCRLKRSAAVASVVERMFGDPTMPYTLVGRILVASRSREEVRRIAEEHERNAKKISPVARAMSTMLNPEGRPAIYLDTERLMAHREFVPGLSIELWWLAPLVSESREVVMTVAIGEDVSWRGIASMKTPPPQAAVTSPRMGRYRTAEPAVETVRTMDAAALWTSMLEGMSADSRHEIQKEMIEFEKTVMENKSFAHDFLPRLGPEWELAIIPQDPKRFSTPPKHLLPIVQATVQIRDPWASRKIRDMLVTLADRIRYSLQKDRRDMPFTLQEENTGVGTVIRFVLQGSEAHRLGEAFVPGVVLTPDALVMTSYLPYTQSVMASPHPAPEDRDAGERFTLHGSPLISILDALKEAVVDSVVNDHFRMKVEPDVDRAMGDRAARGEFAQADRKIRDQIKREASPADLEREVQRRLSKHIYEEKLAMMEDRLASIARTPEYARMQTEVRDQVRRWIGRVGLIDDLVQTTRPRGESLSIEGRLRLRRKP